MKASAFDAKAGVSSVTSLPTTNRNLLAGDLSFKNEELRQEEQRQKQLANKRQQAEGPRDLDGPRLGESGPRGETGSVRSNRWLAERSRKAKGSEDERAGHDQRNLRASSE